MKLKTIMAIGCIAIAVLAVGLFTIEMFGASQEACAGYCWKNYGGLVLPPPLPPIPILVAVCMDGCIYGSQL